MAGAAKQVADISEEIDYTHFNDADRRELNQNVIRGLEQQYEATRMDAAKRRRDIARLEKGNHGLDQRFVAERLSDLRRALESARVTLFTTKLDIEWHREELARLPEPPKDDEG